VKWSEWHSVAWCECKKWEPKVEWEGWRENLYLLILWTDGIFHHIKWLTTWHLCLRQVHSMSLAQKKFLFLWSCSLNYCCYHNNNNDDDDENVFIHVDICGIHAWKICHREYHGSWRKRVEWKEMKFLNHYAQFCHSESSHPKIQ